MAREVDARGLPCPQPVVNTKKALEEADSGTVTILVDSKESLENVRRFAMSQGYRVAVSERDGAFCLSITREGPETVEKMPTGDVVLITSNQLGTGDDKLGESLLKGFINNLAEVATKPSKIFFINSGVKLTTEGSGVLEALKRLQLDGVQILSCGTCLEYYQLMNRLEVGMVTNMYEVVDSLLEAGKVIRV